MTHTPEFQQTVSTLSLLNRILSAPDLVTQIQTLPAPKLLRIIQHIGLEDSAELLVLATTDQLTRMLDDDLWRQEAPGKAEAFSGERLSIWLTALEEMGSQKAAEKLIDMDEEFLTFAFSHYLHAIDSEALQFMHINIQGDSWEDDRLEKLLENHNSHEMAGALLLAKATAPWDTLLNLLIALDQADNSLCGRLVQRLCAVTEDKAEKEGGLFEVLSQEEMLESDATYSRELRRARDGYLSAQEAIAFMEWIKVTPAETIIQMKGRRDPISRAYFREYQGVPLSSAPAAEASRSFLLEIASEPEERSKSPSIVNSDRPLFAFLNEISDQSERERFLMELNFMAQAILLTDQSGSTRQFESAEAVIETCERGLVRAAEKSPGMSAVQLFALGSK